MNLKEATCDDLMEIKQLRAINSDLQKRVEELERGEETHLKCLEEKDQRIRGLEIEVARSKRIFETIRGIASDSGYSLAFRVERCFSYSSNALSAWHKAEKGVCGQEIKATCRVLSADFEENSITLIMPKDFWAKYKVRRGEVELTNISALVAIESEAGK